MQHYLEANQDYRNDTLRHGAEFTEEDIRVDTAKHYDDCYWDYRTAWFDNENLALHARRANTIPSASSPPTLPEARPNGSRS